jgi:NAD(P)H-flavin reductase
VIAYADQVVAALGSYPLGTIVDVRDETADTRTIAVGDLPPATLAGRPGQFLMLHLPGFSAVPISISRYRADTIDLTIRAAGASTKAITSLHAGSRIGLRGPVGRGWPVDEASGGDVVIVAGGIGLAPLRPVIDACLADRERFGRVRLYYGARTPHDRLFTAELDAWAADPAIEVKGIVDRADQGWPGAVGVVTQLFDRDEFDPPRTVAFVCGPEKMMSASARTLEDAGVEPERLFLSLERNMACGIGLCGHCQFGRFFVCKDGPVLSHQEFGGMLEIEGL